MDPEEDLIFLLRLGYQLLKEVAHLHLVINSNNTSC